MLKLKYLFENYDLAKFALENWEHDTERLDEMLSWYRISSNAIYPFAKGGAMRMLRLAPMDEKLENNVVGELEFIQYLRSMGYRAMKPVASKSGETVLKLQTQWGAYYASVFERVDGMQIEETDYNDAIMFQYGKSLGKLHQLSSQFQPKTRKWNYLDAICWMIDELSNCKNTELAIMKINELSEELEKLPKTSNNYGLVHYDFELDNVFYSEETNTCCVIDFDDGMYHWFALDIDQCLDSLAEELPNDKYEQAKAMFLQGYETEYAITEETINMLPIMRRFANLFTYTRIQRAVKEKCKVEPDWMIGLREHLSNIVETIEKTW